MNIFNSLVTWRQNGRYILLSNIKEMISGKLKHEVFYVFIFKLHTDLIKSKLHYEIFAED